MYITRKIESEVLKAIQNYPVTALTGPRQCGKSTLAKKILSNFPDSIYLDLERPSDLLKLENAEWFFSSQKGKLICIDEIQRFPELFPVIRSLVDEWQTNSCFLILGSASQDLLKQSSESLAGRIAYKTLAPFILKEIQNQCSTEEYICKGGFPKSLLTKDFQTSFEWRENFILTFLEKDLLQWTGFTSASMRRLWQMLSHLNGQTINYSTLGNSLGITSTTVKTYIDLLASTYMVEVIPPYISNLGKRLVKAPKIYISDSGISAALLGLKSVDDIFGHPGLGQLWEQIVLSNLKILYPGAEFYFYRTSNGSEVDFVMKYHNKVYVIECKSSYTPILTKGNYNAFEDISADKVFIVTPSKSNWSMKEGIDVISIDDLDSII